MISQIPLQNAPYQNFNILLNNQPCTFNIYQRGDFVYVDLYINGVAMFLGMKAVYGEWVNSYKTSFNGYLAFFNETGTDPQYTDFGINPKTVFLYTDNGQAA